MRPFCIPQPWDYQEHIIFTRYHQPVFYSELIIGSLKDSVCYFNVASQALLNRKFDVATGHKDCVN